MHIKKDFPVPERNKSIQSKIGNQAMLGNTMLNNQQVIQRHPYTEKQLETVVSSLFHSGDITEAQAMAYYESIYSEQGMSDADVAELGLAITIRTQCYPTTFNAAVMQWKAAQINAANQFYCAACHQWFDVSKLTIDHITSVSHHWNTVGYNSDRATRNTFYNDLTNLQLLCRSCNSKKGGEKYTKLPGANYDN